MKNKIIFMDGYDSVRDANTQSNEIFSTILPVELSELLGRNKIPDEVIDNVVVIYNTEDIDRLDKYLLDEGLISQEEREIIIEALYDFENMKKVTLTITLEFADKVSGNEELQKLAENVATAIVDGANGRGIAPENSDTYLTNVTVSSDVLGIEANRSVI